MKKEKILIIRFSSIGDIVLTTPVIRCLKKQLLGIELHFVTKSSFKDTLLHNPYIDKLYTFEKDVNEIYNELKAEKYDIVIDLHNNLRSLRLKRVLKSKNYSFDKINLRKFAAVNLKMLNLLPKIHIVDRYLQAVSPLGIKNDGEGLDYFLSSSDHVDLGSDHYTVIVAGGSYYTKRIPVEKLEEICARLKGKIVLLGGKEDKVVAEIITKKYDNVINGCGQYSMNQSASIILNAERVITSDTGLMHIASAFNKQIISLWGNTIPEFGMAPYKPNEKNKILEVTGLACRPCSKLGFKKCPKGHFKCMMNIDINSIEH